MLEEIPLASREGFFLLFLSVTSAFARGSTRRDLMPQSLKHTEKWTGNGL
jgi:hypothetical protein